MSHTFKNIWIGVVGVALVFSLIYIVYVQLGHRPQVSGLVGTSTVTVQPGVKKMSPEPISDTDEEAVITRWFAPLTTFTLGRITLQASIADTEATRAQGLSGTPYLPIGIAKVFIFDTSDRWSFWMKDMLYPIDIFWLDENGRVVYIVESATPDSYPKTSFTPPVPALYVIETKAGFAVENNVRIGEVAGLTQVLQ